MVRVLSVHHFVSQDIHPCSEVVCASAAPPQRLLECSGLHRILERQLATGLSSEHSFPTVDLACDLVHCTNGNYVATLEYKPGREMRYARVYSQWDKQNTGGIVRARIAGRVTPSSAQLSAGANSGSLEMIEIPLKQNPTALACCQVTGNLIFAAEKCLVFFKFQNKIHDSSKLKFIDFDEIGINIELSFSPTKLFLVENLICAMNSEFLHVIRISDTITQPKVIQKTNQNDVISQNMTHINWEQLIKGDQIPENWTGFVNEKSFPINVDFPSILAEKCLKSPICSNPKNPNIFCLECPELSAKLKLSNNKPSLEKWKINNLLQLKSFKEDQFHCLVFKPLYTRKTNANIEQENDNPLISKHHSQLVGTLCLISTQQEGFLYLIPESTSVAQLVSVYPFTAPVCDLALENSVLHALTETGLETYTVRFGQYVQEIISPSLFGITPFEEPVCLIGWRPFIGVKKLFISGSHLVLFASSNNPGDDAQAWTLYSLRVPDACTLYNDMLHMAKEHRWSSQATYGHLLHEGYYVLWGALTIGSWISSQNLAQPTFTEGHGDKIHDLFLEACALLGEYHLTCETSNSWRHAANFFQRSGLGPSDIVQRITKLAYPDQKTRDRAFRELTLYLKHCLRSLDISTPFSPQVPLLVHTLLDLLDQTNNSAEGVADLVIRSHVLREYATERAMSIIQTEVKARPKSVPELDLGLTVLLVQRGSAESHLEAINTLKRLSGENLIKLLCTHHCLVLEFDKHKGDYNFSDLATLLIEHQPAELAAVLANLVTNNINTLQEILQVFLNFLPSRIGISGTVASSVLQQFLERYFNNFFTSLEEKSNPGYEQPIVEALKILVRSYLSDLNRHALIKPQNSDLSNQTLEKILFENTRPAYLQKMPPFSADLSKRLASPQEIVEKYEPNLNHPTNKSLIKLQALLSSQKLPPECVLEVKIFVETNLKLHGNLSLQVLCSKIREATILVLDFCPQALLQYAKDQFECETDWKCLVALLQRKINVLTENTLLKQFYIQVNSEILTHLAQTLSIDELYKVLPSGETESYQSYISTCHQVSHANHIRALIMATGHQLLNTLNL